MKDKGQLRNRYLVRFGFRIAVLVGVLWIYMYSPNVFQEIEGWGFFQHFTLLHLLWLVWMADMIMQLIPLRHVLPLGSQKQFLQKFRPVIRHNHLEVLRQFINKSQYVVLKIAGVWLGIATVMVFLTVEKVLKTKELFLLTTVFYVLDLFFVLFWCPFRVLFMKNRCCTTCRIFNWDHMMMFTPVVFIGGFFAVSLFVLSVVDLVVWEVCFLLHPERFCEDTNEALTCKNCTDRLCGGKLCCNRFDLDKVK
jgi:hypothetical protein